jgi:hypothetical protein
MILKNHMFKVDLNRFPKTVQVKFVYFTSCPNKESRLQVNEILNFLIFLVNAILKLIYALSISNVKLINVSIF